MSFSRTRSERIGKWRFGTLGRLGEAAPLRALLQVGSEVGRDAEHAIGADRLDASLLDRLEHFARLAALWRQRRVQNRIVTGDGERRRIGMAADHRNLDLVGTREGSGSRAILPVSPGGSLVNTTSMALSAAIERVVSVTARLNGSSGASLRRVMTSSRPRWRSIAADPRRSSADRTPRSTRVPARRIC